MGRSSRSWSGRRAKSLVAAAVGAAAVAAVVARRRRAASQPGQPGPVADEVPTFPVTESVDVQRIPSPEVPERPRPRRRAAVTVGLALLIAAAIAIAAVVVVGGDDDQPRPASAGGTVTTAAERTTTTAPAEASADDAFTLVADRLVSAGSFAYAGTTSAIDVSHVRPGLWLAVDLTVEGEVSTTGSRLHEVAVDASGQAVETVTDGPTVWGRQAAAPAALGDATYLPITEDSGEEVAAKGIALLPSWLRSTVDRHDAGTDALGRRLLRATMPADALGEVVDGRPAADADVVLTLDAAGEPVHVEVASVPTGPPLRLALDLSRIGDAVTIDLP